MMRPLALGTPAEKHTSTCPKFMLILHANWALHAHTKGLLHTHLQLTHISKAGTDKPCDLHTEVWGFPPSCLHSITLAAMFPVPNPGKMEGGRKTYVDTGKARPTLPIDCSSADAQPLTPDLTPDLCTRGMSEPTGCKVPPGKESH